MVCKGSFHCFCTAKRCQQRNREACFGAFHVAARLLEGRRLAARRTSTCGGVKREETREKHHVEGNPSLRYGLP